jgi:eukaryotic-like serine/threonine-protein kinase
MSVPLSSRLGTELLALSLPVLVTSCGCAPLGQGPAKVVATLSTDGKASFTDVAYSGDGRTLAANDRGDRPVMSVTLWDTATWKVRRTLEGPDATTPPWFVLAPDGNHVAGIVEGGVRLWDVPAAHSALLRMEVEGTPDLTFSPDGKFLAVGADKKPYTVTLLDIAAGRAVAALPVGGDRADVLAFSPNGQTLAAGCRFTEPGSEKSRRFVRLWDVASRRQRADLGYGTSIITGIAFSPDGRLLATTDDGVRVWDLADDPPGVRWQQPMQQRTPHGLAFSPDGRVLLVGNGRGEVKFLDAATGKELRRLKVVFGEVSSLALSPDGRLLAVAASRSSLKVWDVAGILNASPQ